MVEEAEIDFMQGRPLSEFPGPQFPVAYADGVLSMVAANGIAKFVFYRFDPNTFGRGGAVTNAFAQVVMPIAGFAEMAIFFSRQLEGLVASGVVSVEQIEKIKAGLDQTSKNNTENG